MWRNLAERMRWKNLRMLLSRRTDTIWGAWLFSHLPTWGLHLSLSRGTRKHGTHRSREGLENHRLKSAKVLVGDMWLSKDSCHFVILCEQWAHVTSSQNIAIICNLLDDWVPVEPVRRLGSWQLFPGVGKYWQPHRFEFQIFFGRILTLIPTTKRSVRGFFLIKMVPPGLPFSISTGASQGGNKHRAKRNERGTVFLFWFLESVERKQAIDGRLFVLLRNVYMLYINTDTRTYIYIYMLFCTALSFFYEKHRVCFSGKWEFSRRAKREHTLLDSSNICNHTWRTFSWFNIFRIQFLDDRPTTPSCFERFLTVRCSLVLTSLSLMHLGEVYALGICKWNHQPGHMIVVIVMTSSSSSSLSS